MDIEKIGTFIKDLRKEKDLTQEQLAEVMNVSRRTVSRWETARSMPDIDVLIELADYFDVEVREILDGERKKKEEYNMVNETVLKMADYSNEEKEKMRKRIHILFLSGAASNLLYFFSFAHLSELESSMYDFIQGLTMGISFGMLIVGVILTSRYAKKIQEFKAKLLKHRKE